MYWAKEVGFWMGEAGSKYYPLSHWVSVRALHAHYCDLVLRRVFFILYPHPMASHLVEHSSRSTLIFLFTKAYLRWNLFTIQVCAIYHRFGSQQIEQ